MPSSTSLLRKHPFLCAVLIGVSLALPALALAQTEVMVTGQDTSTPPKTKRARTDTVGNLTVRPAVCTSPTHAVTSVGTSVASCPASQLSSRQTITICNSAENSGSPLVKVRVDGTSPTMGLTQPGDVLAKGDCVTYAIPSGVTPKCISDTASTAVTSVECI